MSAEGSVHERCFRMVKEPSVGGIRSLLKGIPWCGMVPPLWHPPRAIG